MTPGSAQKAGEDSTRKSEIFPQSKHPEGRNSDSIPRPSGTHRGGLNVEIIGNNTSTENIIANAIDILGGVPMDDLITVFAESPHLDMWRVVIEMAQTKGAL
jgi:hypothetical protein